MGMMIRKQGWLQYTFYAIFGLASTALMLYYLSDTLIHFTTPQQFPVNSFERFPLTWLIFPAELFSFLFGLYFVYTLITDRHRDPAPPPLHGREWTRVAILLPAYNEPADIVDRTIQACKQVRWPGGTTIYLLDDSTNLEDRKNMEALCQKHGCTLVRRKDRTGFKAGNINNAISKAVTEDYFVIFDADQAPQPEFLEATMDHFSLPGVAFVQTPQYFVNEGTPLERTAKVGANIFFQAMCVSRSRDGAMVFCGTNAVIKTAVFREVGGFSYYTATEDIELGLRMNDAGYRGVYVPQVLARGYAPQDFKAYSSQQYRWSNGNLAILRESWLRILAGNFSLRHQMHTLFALGWWMIGIVTLVYILVPIMALLFGLGTHHTWLPTSLLVLLYSNVVMGVLMIYVALRNRTDDRVTVADALLQYSLITNSMFIYARAAVSALFGRYVGFVRTNKKRSASGLSLIKWNLLLAAVCFGFSAYALYNAAIASDLVRLRTFLPISVWLLFYSVLLSSSILFVGEGAPVAAPVAVAAAAPKRSKKAAQA